jgi:hypothetical protein
MSRPPQVLERREFYSTDLSNLFSSLVAQILIEKSLSEMMVLILCGCIAHALSIIGEGRRAELQLHDDVGDSL